MITRVLVLLVATAFFSVNVNAGLIHTDWKVDGDKRATLVEETGVEWLKLNNTAGLSINQVLSSGNYEGWRLPTVDELDNFITTFFAPLVFSDNNTYYPSSSAYRPYNLAWNSWMGIVHADANYYRSYGYHVNENGLAVYSGVSLSRFNTSLANIFVGTGTPSTLDISSAYNGVFLVSDGGTTLSSLNDPSLNANNANAPINNPVVDVSEPAGLGVLAAGLLGVMFARRKKRVV